MSTDTAVADFFDNWAVYRAVIDNDCMEHGRIYAAVAQVLSDRTAPFTVLDLGCGDAAGIAPVLADLPLAGYVGIDIAPAALDFAREMLAPMGDRVELQVCDMLDHLEGTDECFDVILASFALHHFAARSDKRRFLSIALGRLRAGGELILIDVVRRDGESRETYLERYSGLVGTWPLADDIRTRIRSHVSGYDFPEEVSVMAGIAGEAGFSGVTEFYRGGSQTQAAWRLTP